MKKTLLSFATLLFTMCLLSCGSDHSDMIKEFYDKYVVNNDIDNAPEINRNILSKYCTQKLMDKLKNDFQELGYDDDACPNGDCYYLVDAFTDGASYDFDTAYVSKVEMIKNDWYQVDATFISGGELRSKTDKSIYIHLVKDKDGNYKMDETSTNKNVVEASKNEEEEENSITEAETPIDKFYEIASQGRYVWHATVQGGDNKILFFYPESKNAGTVSYISFSSDYTKYYGAYSAKSVYTISGDIISFRLKFTSVFDTEEADYVYKIVENGEHVDLSRIGKPFVFEQIEKTMVDQLNR